MKKFTAVLLALVLVLFSFAACNKEDDSNPSTDYGDYEPVEKFDEEKLKETWSIGEITFANENKVTLPCTVREFIEKSGMHLADESIYANQQMQPGKTFALQLLSENTQIKIDCKNLGTSDVSYLDATVVGFNFFNSVAGNRQITVAAGLTVGITRAEVEDALGIPEGKTSEDSMYTYKEKVSDEQTIRLSISFNSSGIVNSITYKVGK